MSTISDVTTGPQLKCWTATEIKVLAEIGVLDAEAVEFFNGLIYLSGDGVCKRWTHEEYHGAGEAGLFDGERVELIDGEVYIMSPMSERHASGILRVQYALLGLAPQGYLVRTQLPILGDASEPEPDIGLVIGAVDDLDQAIPSTLELVIEVSLSSLKFDQTEKLKVYAQQNIPEYWILNLVDDCLEVYRDPVGDSYRDMAIVKAGESIACLAIPNAEVAVSDLLPKRA